MSESQGGAGRREVAWRLFAAEFDDADFSYSQSDEERAPNYVVTPTGARVNRLFVVGVLTEIETVSEDYLRARVVDPTGPFVIYAGQYQPDALAFLERAEPPTFVAVTGKARTYQPDDSDQVFTSIRPESISEVGAETRDRWVVQTADQTVDRVARMAEAKQSGLSGDELRTALEAHGVEEALAAGIPLALDHYGTTGDYLAAIRELALDSARVVADEIDEAESLDVLPSQGGDDALATLVERPIDVDALEPGEGVTDVDAGSDGAQADEPSDSVAEAGAGNGSAIGTAEASNRSAAASGDADAATSGTGRAESADADATDRDQTDRDDADQDRTAQDQTASTGTRSGGSTADEMISQNSSDDDATSDGPSADESAPGNGPTDTGASEPADESGTVTETGVERADPEATADSDDGEEPQGSDADDLEDFEPEFDLDEDEREELEEEFGTEFQSGTEVSEPGEAGIETPDPDAVEADEQAEGTSEATGAEPTTEMDPVEETEPAPDAATEGEATEPDTDDDDRSDEEAATSDGETGSAEAVDLDEVDLEDAVMDAMTDLDDGDGASRDDVIAAVVDRTGADSGDVEDAVQDALMGGRCYEPDDETLKPI